VLIGGNEITKRDWQGEHFQKSMDRLLHALTQMGATVITMTMIDNSQLFLPHVPWPPIVYERLRSANTLIRKLSDTYGAICLNFESLPQMQPRAIFGVDRVHLNALGYLKVAAEVAHCLTRYSGILITGPSLAVPAERQP